MTYSRDLRRFIKHIEPLVHIVGVIVRSRAQMKNHDRDAALVLLGIIEGKFGDKSFDIFDADRGREEIRQRRADEAQASREAARTRKRRGLPGPKDEYENYVQKGQEATRLAIMQLERRYPQERPAYLYEVSKGRALHAGV